jgi:hypothetical protein
VRPRAYSKIDVRRLDLHLAEKNIGELLIVVLTRMDQDALDLFMALHLAQEGSYFDEIGPGTDHVQYLDRMSHKREKVSGPYFSTTASNLKNIELQFDDYSGSFFDPSDAITFWVDVAAPRHLWRMPPKSAENKLCGADGRGNLVLDLSGNHRERSMLLARRPDGDFNVLT